jgi:VWFA-related protein
MMRRGCVDLAIVLMAPAVRGGAGTVQTTQAPKYTFSVGVDEVTVPFLAADFHGVPIDDVKLSDLRILDNGRKPKKILSFQAYANLPVRVGFVMDTSHSMGQYVDRNRWIATEYAKVLMKKEMDRAFVMNFDFDTMMLQEWTGDTATIERGVHKAGINQSRLGGTAIFDTIYRACRDDFATLKGGTTSNFIMLFTDGEDNASHALLSDAIEMCQRTNTAIYVFSDEPKPKVIVSDGQKTLEQLARESGGRVFFEQTIDGIENDLRTIDADQRNQYRVVYKPNALKHDGTFHHIKLDSPNRGGVFTAKAGYYAPKGSTW